MKKTKIIAFSLVLVFVLNIIMPIMTVVANSSYQISFDARGTTHSLEITDGHLKIDGQFVDLRDSNDQTIGDVNVDNGGKTASITVNDGPAGKLNYNANNLFTLYISAGHNQYIMGTELSSNAVFMVEDFAGSGNNQNSDVEVQFDNATITGNVATFNVNNIDVSLTVNGSNISNNKITVDRNNLNSVSFSLSNTFDKDTMQVVVRGTSNYETILAVNDRSASLSGLNFPDGGIHLSVEPKNSGENDSNHITSNITVTAGNGSYGNNRNYDDEVDFSINGSRWDHSGTIDYSIEEADTNVTFTFETLWINRFYENIVINGVSYNVSNYLDFDDRVEWLNANHGSQTISFDIPNVAKADDYNIVVKHGENTGKKYIATFLWTADPNQANGHDYIGNAKLEFVKAVYYVGNTTYTVTEEDLEGKLHRDGSYMNATSDDGFLNYGYDADLNYDDGNLTLPGDCDITMRVVPEYGYQVIDVNNGGEFTTTDSGVSEFTVHVEEGTAGYFQAKVEKVENTVTPISEKVKAGEIKLGNNAATDIKNGTVRLSVEDIELSSDKISNFQEKANEAGEYTISNYLDINLDKVLYKGSSEDVWSEQIHHLTDKALITLQLDEGVDASNIVIVHNIDNGDEFEIIQIESYDPQTNTITFYTDSFSNYAIASKNSAIEESTTKKIDILNNPTTGDNILMVMSIFVFAVFGTYTTKKIGKSRKIRKH